MCVLIRGDEVSWYRLVYNGYLVKAAVADGLVFSTSSSTVTLLTNIYLRLSICARDNNTNTPWDKYDYSVPIFQSVINYWMFYRGFGYKSLMKCLAVNDSFSSYYITVCECMNCQLCIDNSIYFCWSEQYSNSLECWEAFWNVEEEIAWLIPIDYNRDTVIVFHEEGFQLPGVQLVWESDIERAIFPFLFPEQIQARKVFIQVSRTFSCDKVFHPVCFRAIVCCAIICLTMGWHDPTILTARPLYNFIIKTVIYQSKFGVSRIRYFKDCELL